MQEEENGEGYVDETENPAAEIFLIKSVCNSKQAPKSVANWDSDVKGRDEISRFVRCAKLARRLSRSSCQGASSIGFGRSVSPGLINCTFDSEASASVPDASNKVKSVSISKYNCLWWREGCK